MSTELRRRRASGLSRWLRRGELADPRVRRHAEQLAAELAASLGGVQNLSAQQAVALEHICLSRIAVLLALDEIGKTGAFVTASTGDRAASPGYQSLVRALSESRQQLAQVGLAKVAIPVTFSSIVKEAAEQAEADAKSVTDAELAEPMPEQESQ